MSGLADSFAAGELAALESRGLLRHPDDGAARAASAAAARDLGVPFIDASSNDYLGFAAGGVSRETSVQGAPGAGASRLIHGTRPEHVELERALAAWIGAPAALLFSSGYAANVGLLQALGTDGTVIVSDALNHASIVNGCRLARARVEVVPHLDVGAVEGALAGAGSSRARWVVVESLFSMDGDGSDLTSLRAICDRYRAGLVVDEAHALGVFGPRGSGRCRADGVVPDALVGTLGKAVGAQGAFVAGSDALRTLLWNRARPFVFSTAPSPLLAELGLFHVQRAESAEPERTRLHAFAAELRDRLAAHGVVVADGRTSGVASPIIPIIVGSNERALGVAVRLGSSGILAQAIRYPTVPQGTARLRVTVSAAWPDGAPARVASAVASALAEVT